MAHRSFAAQTKVYFIWPHEGLPPGPISSPAAWQGAEMRQRESLGRRVLKPANIDFHCDAADVVELPCPQPARTGGKSRIVSAVTLFNRLLDCQPDLAPRLFAPFKLDRRGENRSGPSLCSQLPPCWFAEGEMQFLSNHTIARARTVYNDDPERPRHLLRLWLSLSHP